MSEAKWSTLKFDAIALISGDVLLFLKSYAHCTTLLYNSVKTRPLIHFND